MRLVLATPSQEHTRDQATWTTWGGPLALEAYLALVQRLRNHAWSRATLTTWLLRSDEGETLASCQAYRMASRFGASPGHAYGLGSVFTEPAQRGRGLATVLLNGLAERLAEMDPQAQACFLFAEAGATPYLRAGFQERPVRTLAFPARTGEPGQGVDSLLSTQLSGDDLAGVLADPPWPEGAFAIRPSGLQLDWQCERERILFEVLGRPGPPARGARAGQGLALWVGNPHRQGLSLLHFDATTPGEAHALIEAARRTAHASGLPRVLLWEGPEAAPWHLLPTLRSGEVEAAPGGPRPMIRPLSPGIQGSDWARIQEAIRI